MNKQKFIEFLHKPGNLSAHDLSELDDLIDTYPYFQTAHALLAKGSRINKTPEAGKRTAAAAVHTTNRLLLKKYLTSDIYFLKPIESNESVDTSEDKKATTPQVAQPTGEEPTPETQEVSAPPATSSSSSIDQIINDLHRDMEDLDKSRARYLEITRKLEEEEAVEKAVKKATEKKGPDTKSTTPKTTTSTKTTSGRKTTSGTKKSTPKKTTTTKKAAVTKKTATPKKSTKSPTKKSTTSKKSSTTKTTSKPTPRKSTTKKSTPTKKASASKTTAKKTSTRSKSTSGKTKQTAKKSSSSSTTAKKKEPDLAHQKSLIDNFIKVNPTFSPNKDQGNDSDYSEESTKLHKDAVSEYLAEIFLEQGKNDRAIEIYNSLMLRFPEKKAYFAGRIKKIK